MEHNFSLFRLLFFKPAYRVGMNLLPGTVKLLKRLELEQEQLGRYLVFWLAG